MILSPPIAGSAVPPKGGGSDVVLLGHLLWSALSAESGRLDEAAAAFNAEPGDVLAFVQMLVADRRPDGLDRFFEVASTSGLRLLGIGECRRDGLSNRKFRRAAVEECACRLGRQMRKTARTKTDSARYMAHELMTGELSAYVETLLAMSLFLGVDLALVAEDEFASLAALTLGDARGAGEDEAGVTSDFLFSDPVSSSAAGETMTATADDPDWNEADPEGYYDFSIHDEQPDPGVQRCPGPIAHHEAERRSAGYAAALPEDLSESAALGRRVASTLVLLTAREERMMRLRYGIGPHKAARRYALDNDGATLDYIGIQLGLTREGVRIACVKAERRFLRLWQLEEKERTPKAASAAWRGAYDPLLAALRRVFMGSAVRASGARTSGALWSLKRRSVPSKLSSAAHSAKRDAAGKGTVVALPRRTVTALHEMLRGMNDSIAPFAAKRRKSAKPRKQPLSPAWLIGTGAFQTTEASGEPRPLVDAATKAAIDKAKPRGELGDFLGAYESSVDMLIEEGHLTPFAAASAAGLDDRYEVEMLFGFLKRLLGPLPRVPKAGIGQYGIVKAAKLVKCPQADIVRMLLDGMLPGARAASWLRGFSSVLVDIDEVIAASRSPGNLIPLEAAAVFLNTTAQALFMLTVEGILPPPQTTHGRYLSRWSRYSVKLSDLIDFQHDYVSIAALCKHGVGRDAAIKRLTSAGVSPGLDAAAVGDIFYRRRDAARVFPAAGIVPGGEMAERHAMRGRG